MIETIMIFILVTFWGIAIILQCGILVKMIELLDKMEDLDETLH